MSALPLDVALATREAAIVTWSDGAILARFPRARDGQEAPAQGFCDTVLDTATILSLRGVLIGTVRRRFLVKVDDVLIPDLDAGIPCWHLVDAEQGVDAVHFMSRIEVDFETETTSIELLG